MAELRRGHTTVHIVLDPDLQPIALLAYEGDDGLRQDRQSGPKHGELLD